MNLETEKTVHRGIKKKNLQASRKKSFREAKGTLANSALRYMDQDADPTLPSTSPVTLNSLPLPPRLQGPLSQTRGWVHHKPHNHPPLSNTHCAVKQKWVQTTMKLWGTPSSPSVYFLWIAKKKKKKFHFFIPDSPKPKFTFLLTGNYSGFYFNFVGVK